MENIVPLVNYQAKKKHKICFKNTKMRFLCIAILKGEVYKHGLIWDHWVKASGSIQNSPISSFKLDKSKNKNK